MELLHVVVLALIQGFTEFLPISSSAHLILPSELLGWPDQGLAFDVAVHLGTLAAVLVYFRHDLVAISRGWFGQFGAAGANQHSHLGWMLIIATIPAGLAGLLFHEFVELQMRSIVVIASTTVLFGLALGWADLRSSHQRHLLDISWQVALLIGCAQALALVPGTSRSGVTITAALLFGFAREDAAKFSFLMSIPIIFLSGAFEVVNLTATEGVHWGSILLGGIIAGSSAYLCIHFFLSFISRLSMKPFVVYRLLLGAVLFLIAAL